MGSEVVWGPQGLPRVRLLPRWSHGLVRLGRGERGCYGESPTGADGGLDLVVPGRGEADSGAGEGRADRWACGVWGVRMSPRCVGGSPAHTRWADGGGTGAYLCVLLETPFGEMAVQQNPEQLSRTRSVGVASGRVVSKPWREQVQMGGKRPRTESWTFQSFGASRGALGGAWKHEVLKDRWQRYCQRGRKKAGQRRQTGGSGVEGAARPGSAPSPACWHLRPWTQLSSPFSGHPTC